jgi:hypothetical protein
MPPFALTPDVVAQAVVNVLAVGGAFLLGQVLVGVGMWCFAPNSPPGLKRGCRLLGGAGLAVLVAIIVFGHGQGWTLFGGGGTGDSKGNGPTEQKGEGTGTTTAPTAPATPSAPTPATAPEPATGPKVRVTVLGGADVKDERFYQLDADPAAKTFAELTAALAAKKAAGHTVRAEVVFSAANTLPRDHPAVTRLTAWALANGVTVTFPAP